MSDAALVAAITAIPPTLAVLWSQRQTRAQLSEVHAIVNSRLDQALRTISALEAEIRELKATLAKERPHGN